MQGSNNIWPPRVTARRAASTSPSCSGGSKPVRASRTADVAETLLMVALMAAGLFLAAV